MYQTLAGWIHRRNWEAKPARPCLPQPAQFMLVPVEREGPGSFGASSFVKITLFGGPKLSIIARGYIPLADAVKKHGERGGVEAKFAVLVVGALGPGEGAPFKPFGQHPKAAAVPVEDFEQGAALVGESEMEPQRGSFCSLVVIASAAILVLEYIWEKEHGASRLFPNPNKSPSKEFLAKRPGYLL